MSSGAPPPISSDGLHMGTFEIKGAAAQPTPAVNLAGPYLQVPDRESEGQR